MCSTGLVHVCTPMTPLVTASRARWHGGELHRARTWWAAPYPQGVAVPMLTELQRRRTEILDVARARGASRVRVFGSVARGDATETSDIDFLVDFEEGRNLLDLGGLLMDLRELLGHDVDVVTEAGLRSRVVSRVLADAVDL
jgi:uncharacterized protein